jgi:hypothetical protein
MRVVVGCGPAERRLAHLALPGATRRQAMAQQKEVAVAGRIDRDIK